MTTIAYRDGVLAADSGCYGEDQICCHIQKVFRLANGALWGSAGDSDDHLVRLLLGNDGQDANRKALVETGCTINGLLILPDRRIFMVSASDDQGAEIVEALSAYAAVGNGSDVALGAMAMGATAEQAIEAAAKHNVWTHLPVQMISF